MSFLKEIQSKTLKPTSTTITQPDGQKFLQTGTHRVRLPPSPGYVIDTKPDTVPALILPTLFLGSQDSCDLSTLTTHNIQNVLSIGIPAPNKHNNVNYRFVECLDLPETDLRDVFAQSFDFIDRGNVLVHCNAGVSRSSAVVVGYLMDRKGLGYEEALGLVKRARSCVRPNDGFARQLRNLEKTKKED